MSVLVLPSYPHGYAGEATSVTGSASVPATRKVEAVGRAFQATKHPAPKPSVASAADASASSAGNSLQLRDVKYDRYKKFDIDLNDYYTLLGLDERMFDATKDEITEAYRTICKVIHPDKSLPEDRVKAEERYKALQVGWETLTDAARRRGYDSSLDFDESLPKESAGATEKTFFSVYGPVFDANSRFSTIRPVPKLGDMTTPDNDVVEFYDFWNNFSSWREFPELNENAIESASCRQQKREYQRENEKKQAAKKKEELARVRKLTENASKKDPRMIRMRRDADESKNAAKNKKAAEAAEKEAAAKQKALDDANRVQREKEQKIRDDENKKVLKEVMKKVRAAFGKSCKAAGLEDGKVDELRASLELEQLQEIVEAFAADAKSAVGLELFNAYVTQAAEAAAAAKSMSAEQLAASKLAAKKLEEEQEAASAKPWTHEEESQLVKAVGKFPGGTVLRWEKITDMVNAVTQRSMKDVIKKSKMMETSALGTQHVDDSTAYQLYLAKMMGKKAGDVAASSSSSSAPAPTPAANSDVFTADEQAKFEAALKSVSKDAPTRWDQIAAKVGTKTKAQCMARYKSIAEQVKKGKK